MRGKLCRLHSSDPFKLPVRTSSPGPCQKVSQWPVQPLTEFHHNRLWVGVAQVINQVTELVQVVIDGVAALEVGSGLEHIDCGCFLIEQSEVLQNSCSNSTQLKKWRCFILDLASCLNSWVAQHPAQPLFMYKGAQMILVSSSVKASGQRWMSVWQDMRNALPLVWSPSKSAGTESLRRVFRLAEEVEIAGVGVGSQGMTSGQGLVGTFVSRARAGPSFKSSSHRSTWVASPWLLTLSTVCSRVVTWSSSGTQLSSIILIREMGAEWKSSESRERGVPELARVEVGESDWILKQPMTSMQVVGRRLS